MLIHIRLAWVFTVTGALVSAGLALPVWSSAVKPRLSALPDSLMPRGCSYTVDDWKGSQLVWAPYPAQRDISLPALVAIDGSVRRLRINGLNDDYLSAYDGTYYIDVRTEKWTRVGEWSLRQARAIMTIRNTKAYVESKLIVRASQGC